MFYMPFEGNTVVVAERFIASLLDVCDRHHVSTYGGTYILNSTSVYRQDILSILLLIKASMKGISIHRG
jgi:hypothetical protein